MKITEEIRTLAVKNSKNSGILEVYKEQKRLDAIAREEAYRELSPIKKCELLDSRLGVGKGAKRERNRIIKLMQKLNYRQDVIDKHMFAGKDAYAISI